MGLGFGLFLIAVGAILTWAVDVNSSSVDVNTIGVILMIIGAVGIVLSMIFWSTWGGFHRRDVVEEGPRRRQVIDEY
jgi:hypothetical protein